MNDVTEKPGAWSPTELGAPAAPLEQKRFAEGSRVRCYSGPHYGRIHIVEGTSGSGSLVLVNHGGDRFAVPACDLEAA